MAAVSQSSSIPHVEQLHRLLEESSYFSDSDDESGYLGDHQMLSMMQKIFKIAEQIGINEENYLPWKNQYEDYEDVYTNMLSCSDRQGKKLGWGCDPEGRLFITFQYTIETEDEKKEGSSTIFQRWPNNREVVSFMGITEGYKKSRTCEFNDMMLKELDSLFKSGTLTQTYCERGENFQLVEKERKITLFGTT